MKINKRICADMSFCMLTALYCNSTHTQPAITREANLPRTGDTIKLAETESLNAGGTGKNAVWDFSDTDCDSPFGGIFLVSATLMETIRLTADRL